VLYVTRAPNPTEIKWEHLAIERMERWKRWAITWAVMLLVLGIAGIANWQLEVWRQGIREREIGCEDNACETTGISSRWVGLIVPLLTALINGILMVLSRVLSAREYHDTLSDKESSLIWKMSSVLVFNTVLMQIAVRGNGKKEWYLSGGLAFDIMLLIVMNSCISPGVVLLDIGFRVKQRLVKRIDVETTKLPRAAYNKYYEPGELNVPMQFSLTIKMVTLVVFYMPLLPWAPGLGIFGILLQFWANKYMVVRKFKRPTATCGMSNAETALQAMSVYVLISLSVVES